MSTIPTVVEPLPCGCTVTDPSTWSFALGAVTGPEHRFGPHRSLTLRRNLRHDRAHELAAEHAADAGRWTRVEIWPEAF